MVNIRHDLLYNQGSREQLAIAEFANSLLVIPKTLAVNAAQDSAELVAKLRAYHNTSQINTERASFKWYVFYNKSYKKIYREISVVVPKNFSTEFRQNASIIMAISKARTLFQSSLFGWHVCDNCKGESYAQKEAGQTERKLLQKTAM